MTRIEAVPFQRPSLIHSRGHAPEFVACLEKSVIVPQNNILVMHNVGKQAEWAQCYLKKHNRTEDYFLKRAVSEWYKQGFDEQGNKRRLLDVAALPRSPAPAQLSGVRVRTRCGLGPTPYSAGRGKYG